MSSRHCGVLHFPPICRQVLLPAETRTEGLPSSHKTGACIVFYTACKQPLQLYAAGIEAHIECQVWHSPCKHHGMCAFLLIGTRHLSGSTGQQHEGASMPWVCLQAWLKQLKGKLLGCSVFMLALLLTMSETLSRLQQPITDLLQVRSTRCAPSYHGAHAQDLIILGLSPKGLHGSLAQVTSAPLIVVMCAKFAVYADLVAQNSPVMGVGQHPGFLGIWSCWLHGFL